MELNDSMVSKTKIEPLKEDGEENEGFQAEEGPEEGHEEDSEEREVGENSEEPEDNENAGDPDEEDDRDEPEDRPEPPDSPVEFLKVAPEPDTLSETRSRNSNIGWSHAIKKNLKLLTSK